MIAKRLRPIPVGRWLLKGAAAITLGFILLPLVLVTWLAFFRQEIPSFPPEGYSLQWFAAVPANKAFVNGFILSFQVGITATIIGLALAVPASLAIARRRFRGRAVANSLLLMPLIVPGVVHWAHPEFMGYFGCTTTAPGILAEMIAAALNVNAMTWRTSPVATELETVIL